MVLKLSEFDFEIMYREGASTDGLSRQDRELESDSNGHGFGEASVSIKEEDNLQEYMSV